MDTYVKWMVALNCLEVAAITWNLVRCDFVRKPGDLGFAVVVNVGLIIWGVSLLS